MITKLIGKMRQFTVFYRNKESVKQKTGPTWRVKVVHGESAESAAFRFRQWAEMTNTEVDDFKFDNVHYLKIEFSVYETDVNFERKNESREQLVIPRFKIIVDLTDKILVQ